MKTIEDVLDSLKGNMCCLVILKAHEGYSAVGMSRKEYVLYFLCKDHFNASTIEEAVLTIGKAIQERKE